MVMSENYRVFTVNLGRFFREMVYCGLVLRIFSENRTEIPVNFFFFFFFFKLRTNQFKPKNIDTDFHSAFPERATKY